MLGNANVILVAAAVPAVFGSARPRNGILLGLATAVFAKPLVLPILLWLLVWRRGTFVGVVASGVVASLFGDVDRRTRHIRGVGGRAGGRDPLRQPVRGQPWRDGVGARAVAADRGGHRASG